MNAKCFRANPFAPLANYLETAESEAPPTRQTVDRVRAVKRLAVKRDFVLSAYSRVAPPHRSARRQTEYLEVCRLADEWACARPAYTRGGRNNPLASAGTPA